MKRNGQVVLFNFPQTNQKVGKLRPALVLGKFPGQYDDWLICMISSKLHHYIKNFDEIIHEDATDFLLSGLKTTSIIRVGRLAVIEESMLLGSMGEIASERLQHIKSKLANWFTNNQSTVSVLN